MAVAAMGRSDAIGVAERHAGADRRRLLPDRQMHRAVAQAANVRILGGLLEAANAVHPPQRAEHLVRRQKIIDPGTATPASAECDVNRIASWAPALLARLISAFENFCLGGKSNVHDRNASRLV